MERRKIVLDLPLPPKECSPNARCHWAQKARAVKKARAMAATIAKAAMIGEPFKRASLHMHFYNARRTDNDNAIAACKPLLDGLQDAGVIDNDSGFIIHPPLQASGKASGGKRGLVLTVTEETE